MRVFVDFNNLDPEGCLRLNLVGTLQDLEAQHLVLEAGMLLTGSDGDLNARIIVLHPGREGVWRGQVVEGPFEDGIFTE